MRLQDIFSHVSAYDHNDRGTPQNDAHLQLALDLMTDPKFDLTTQDVLTGNNVVHHAANTGSYVFDKIMMELQLSSDFNAQALEFQIPDLTTGKAAKICNVAPRTVSKWFDEGTLKGYKLANSEDRRIPFVTFAKFVKEKHPPESLANRNLEDFIRDQAAKGNVKPAAFTTDNDDEKIFDVLMEQTNKEGLTPNQIFEQAAPSL